MGTVAALAPARDRKAEALKKAAAKQSVRGWSRERMRLAAALAESMKETAHLRAAFFEANGALVAASAVAGAPLDPYFALHRNDQLQDAFFLEFVRLGAMPAGDNRIPDICPPLAEVIAKTDIYIAQHLRQVAGL